MDQNTESDESDRSKVNNKLIDGYCTRQEQLKECFDENMNVTIEMCLNGDESIFNKDGMKVIKQLLENLCKEDGNGLKSKMIFKNSIYQLFT